MSATTIKGDHIDSVHVGEDDPLLPTTALQQDCLSLNTSVAYEYTQSIPIQTPSSRKKRISAYDVSSTMTRLRDSMVGTTPPSNLRSNSIGLSSSFDGSYSHNYERFTVAPAHHLLELDFDKTASLNTTRPRPKTRTESPLPSTNKRREDLESVDQKLGLSSSHECITVGKYNSFQPLSSSIPSQKNNYHELNDAMDKNLKNNMKQITLSQQIMNGFHQIPAVALIAMFHLMIGIPFGVSYFPVGWKEEEHSFNTNSTSSTDDTENNDPYINGPFPIQGKNALGIRMFLFSTIIGQIIFTLKSGFHNPIGLQMVENVPFCQALATITIKHCGYGTEALSTLFVMFGFSSILVGIVFYVLGKFQLGKIIYFFPSHVLVGLIAGIGIFIAKTGIEVTINAVCTLQSLESHYQLLEVVFIFELFLRILEKLNVMYGKNGKPLFSLLSPIYFCSITPIFYLFLWVMGMNVNDPKMKGYFFPSLINSCNGIDSCLNNEQSSVSKVTLFLNDTILNNEVYDMWRVIDFSNISWVAIGSSIPTLISITIFSLIHVPINIPAFAVSTNCEYDMNKELIAHGYSNCISGIFGGLQNYMAYTQSILYDRSGGKGKVSGFSVGIITAMLYFVGPSIASYIPRCMAGTLLLHVGIDLFLEGVYDTIGKFERLEYFGIWLIAVVMTFVGMDGAMVAGAITAVSTYAAQTVSHITPLRGFMSAATLRSSQRNRGFEANVILDSKENGRSRILVIQLQGHLFFGNIAQLNYHMNRILAGKQDSVSPLIVIVDFSLVLGIDSSAAQAVVKLKKVMLQTYKVKLCVFVPGSSDGFPCQYNLSSNLDDNHIYISFENSYLENVLYTNASNVETGFLMHSLHNQENFKYEGSQVCQTLDLGLALAENALIFWQNPDLLGDFMIFKTEKQPYLTEDEERTTALFHLGKIYSRVDISEDDIQLLFSFFEREVYTKDDMLWRQGSPSNCAKLLLSGKLIAMLENEAGTYETVQEGRMVGELGLVAGMNRMNSLFCLSEQCICYSISRNSFDELTRTKPRLARVMDLICIEYLADRVQHVSNRIFETRCLPI